MILRLTPSPEWDNVQFVVDVSNDKPISFKGCSLEMISNVCVDFQDEIREEILRVGISAILQRQLILESIVAPGATKDAIKELLIGFLQSIDVHGELIIIDPYFFAPTSDTDYAQRFVDILDPFLSILTSLKIVTLPNPVDVSLKASILGLLNSQKASLGITCHTSAKFHDRYWISDDRKQGLVTGTYGGTSSRTRTAVSLSW
jgi:hypothetical protein